MNTEQLKTKEEILAYYAGFTVDQINDSGPVIIVQNEALKAMEIFASQESKRAVDEFKEKLKTKIKADYKDEFLFATERIIDLIDKI